MSQFHTVAQAPKKKRRATQRANLRETEEELPRSGAIVGPRDLIKQAARDIRGGLIDTDRRRLPDDVPGPHIDPEQTPGADVPPEGVDRNKGTIR